MSYDKQIDANVDISLQAGWVQFVQRKKPRHKGTWDLTSFEFVGEDFFSSFDFVFVAQNPLFLHSDLEAFFQSEKKKKKKKKKEQ